MRCYICNAVIEPNDVHYDTRYEGQKYGPISPCVSCQIQIDEAFEDPLTEEEIDDLLDEDEEILPDTQRLS